MSPYLRVVLCGFNEFEQRALNTVLRLGGSRTEPYVQVAEVADADLIVGNADVPAVVAAIAAAGREADTVFIGSRRPVRASTCLRRPIDAMQVLRELDAMRAHRFERRAEAVPASRPSPDQPAPQPPAATAQTTTAVAVPKSNAKPAALDETALVVDDSLIAASLLHLRVRQIGLDVEVADNSQRALELLAHRPFAWVFLGVGAGLGGAGGLDALALCRHIKRWHLHAEACPPKVVMLSAHYSPLDRVRGTFAGCDHYLAKPVDDDTLRQLLLPSHRPAKARAPRRWTVAPARATASRS